MPIEAPTLRGIRRRVAEIRSSPDFNGKARLAAAIKALKADYGHDGTAAATMLETGKGLLTAIDELAIRYLVPLRLHSRKAKPLATGAVRRLQNARPAWRTLVYGIREKRDQPGPDLDAALDHPEYLERPKGSPRYAYALANATVSEIAMDLAEAYDEARKASPFMNQSRSLELDDIIVALGPELLDFAKISVPEKIDKHRRIANAYRRFEDIAEAVRGEALVDKGGKALEAVGAGPEGEEIKGANGETVTALQVKRFIQTIGTLPAFGDYDRSKLPSRTVAMARAVQGLGYEGITFTLNLHQLNFGRFQAADRGTHSAIQGDLQKKLKAKFGRTVDFYFVLEQGVDEAPHLHGAIALDPSPANLKTVRDCLKMLGRVDQRQIAPERLVHVDKLYTPGRWGGYAVKASNVSAIRYEAIGVENTLGATRGVRKQARHEWELMRAEQRDAKKVIRASRTKG